jgi:hypothetical protein
MKKLGIRSGTDSDLGSGQKLSILLLQINQFHETVPITYLESLRIVSKCGRLVKPAVRTRVRAIAILLYLAVLK